MSGSWDRPPTPRGADWPSEDVGPERRDSEPRDGQQEAWGSEGSSLWDDAAPPAAPAYDYAGDESIFPSSDPWAESWTDEGAEAAAPAPPPVASEPEAAAPAPPPVASEPEPTAPQPPPLPRADAAAPPPSPVTWEPDADAAPGPPAETERRAASEPPSNGSYAPADADTGAPPLSDPGWTAAGSAAPAPETALPPPETGREDLPRPAPWTPGDGDSDFWTYDAEPAAEPRAEAAAEPPSEPAPSPGAGEPAYQTRFADEAGAAAPPAPHASPWQPDSAPDWLVEPLPIRVSEPEPEPEAEPEPQVAAAPPAEPATEIPTEPATELPTEIVTEPPTVPPPAATGSIFPQPASEPITHPETAPPEAEPKAEAEALAAPQPEPTVESLAEFEPAAAADEADLFVEPAAAVALPEVEPEPPAVEPEEDVVAAETEAEQETTPPQAETPAESAEPEAADAEGRPLTVEPERAEPLAPLAETDAGEPEWRTGLPEPTQVLPSSWTPPPPGLREQSGPLAPTAGAVRTSLAIGEAEAEELETTTAEQAVPWLIGVILLLGGMVIVLLALIFAGEGSLGGAVPTPSPEGAGGLLGGADDTPSPAGTPGERSTPTPAPTETPPLGPQYGPLEVVYQGRSMASAPIYLLRRDFTQPLDTTVVLARDDEVDVRRFAWAPDGTVGAALLAEVLVSVEPGEAERQLATEIDTITFGADSRTVYGAEVTQNAAQDVAVVVAIDFASGEATELASISYARPVIAEEADLQEAQFADEGGTVRLYWMENDTLRLWILGGGTWEIDPEGGEPVEVEDAIPTLWAPEGDRRIDTSVSDGVTTLAVVDEDGEPGESTTVDGLVSHLRWSPQGRQVIFTLGRQAPGGGILQDLYLWNLESDEEPTALTTEGAAFGVEWLGTQPLWRD